MSQKKSIATKHKLPQTINRIHRSLGESGLWIDPDIWRRIKGEGGRRGIEGLPSTNRYLHYHYADLALKSKKKPNAKVTTKSKNKARS
jgi:hypothetical protein